MIYKNAKTCLLTNGHRSCYSPISRSMRQGCPVSPLIFILQTEPLACAIRKNTNIIGFSLPNTAQDNQAQDNHEQKQVKINAYVDDAQVFNSTENSIKESFKGDIQTFFYIICILCLLVPFVLWTCLSKTKPQNTHWLPRYGTLSNWHHYFHVRVVSLGKN